MLGCTVLSYPSPCLRGWFHQIAFFVSVPAGIALVAFARGAEGRVTAAIFATSLTGLYGVRRRITAGDGRSTPTNC